LSLLRVALKSSRYRRAVPLLLVAIILMASAVVSYAQFFRGGRRPSADRSQYPMWEINEPFKNDVFTFVRIQFDSAGRRGGGGSWTNDYPDSDWNFPYRLQQLTSLQVDPNSRVMRLTDEDLPDYPFIFMSNVQGISLSNAEELGLRKYLLNGGFMMADDFWTRAAWRHVQGVMKRVLPNSKPRELTADHEIFNIVYQFDEIPRVLSIRAWERGLDYEDWHDWSEPQDRDPHFMGYFDDDGRMVGLFCLNSDVGDGWEREGENHEFFENYSVKVSYPLGINIVTYAMTH
jgi:hypothetical protein